MDHDHLFKELLTTFIREFISLFLPEVAGYLDPTAPIEFLDKEIFTDIASSESHEVDLVAKVRFSDHEGFFLIHVENQASPRTGFPRRMFSYFARLHEKYTLPVYPVVLFSYDSPMQQEPHVYKVDFPDKTVLQFDYTVVQLNQLSWRDFIDQPNPVATALLAKMRVEAKDRPKVKVEFNQLTVKDQEKTMELTTSWHQDGMQAGKEEIVVRQINRHVGLIPPQTIERIDRLNSDELNDLGDALFDFKSIADLESWLDRYGKK
jgi:hypothetical protein